MGSLLAFSLAIAYGGGLGLHLLHELEGGHELLTVHPVLHWLRDSSLALPLVILSAWLALRLAGSIIRIRVGVPLACAARWWRSPS